MVFLLSTFRVRNSFPPMDHVVMVPASAPQESQGSQEVLDPRDQQVLRDHLALKDPPDHEETKVTPANKEVRDLQGHWDPRAQWVQEEPMVTKVLKEAKVLQAPRDLQGHWEVTGSSACLKNLNEGKDTGLIKVNIELTLLFKV